MRVDVVARRPGPRVRDRCGPRRPSARRGTRSAWARRAPGRRHRRSPTVRCPGTEYPQRPRAGADTRRCSRPLRRMNRHRDPAVPGGVDETLRVSTQLSEYDEKYAYSVKVSSGVISAGICSSRQSSHNRRCSGYVHSGASSSSAARNASHGGVAPRSRTLIRRSESHNRHFIRSPISLSGKTIIASRMDLSTYRCTVGAILANICARRDIASRGHPRVALPLAAGGRRQLASRARGVLHAPA